ncbi:unnamed protein product [Phytophthora fragariaefolia]|uniref:Unnamed protein product n=1 Tax=Phytophthora fragariaefolia TaxID=1490495 RepID=A0A9W6Y5E6_9STRA|nr:unnamed protein product [Phytophthora fragariaefolia]
MLAARRMASEMSRDVNGVVSGTALHDSEQLHTFVNEVTGDVDGDVNLGALPCNQGASGRGLSKEPPSGLPSDRGVRHEIDLVPGIKYCVTRPWPIPRKQCDVIDAFVRAKHEAGLVRESKSPHSTPTFCVRKPNGKWRIVHAFNKLNTATIPAQIPIPRKDVLQNNMVGCTLYSALDLVDGYYQLLMRASDIPLAAVSTPGGMLWEWLVMPQGLSNAPATFNRLVTQLFRPHRAYAQTYFDDIFVHSRAELGKTDMENHVEHLRAVHECMRTNILYANIDKCIFGAEEIPFLGCSGATHSSNLHISATCTNGYIQVGHMQCGHHS